MTTIANQIRALKVGDRVRVTREQEVAIEGNIIATAQYGPSIYLNDTTITSIEVIERPLEVGDAVFHATDKTKTPGIVTAIGKNAALIEWNNICGEHLASLCYLRKVTP